MAAPRPDRHHFLLTESAQNPTMAMTNPPTASFGALASIHFSPRRNWMNDPNGLVFHRGRYHLFFQYNPNGPDHGFMSWGHASSTDLVTWEEHPIAMRYRDDAEIYSGSVIWDEGSTAGFGPALIAVYTAHARTRRHQAQELAYSLDDGQTFTRDDDVNPVLDRGSEDFRDPKVLRFHGPRGDYWVMVAVEAVERRAMLYRSDDLHSWTYLSDFRDPALGDGIWECPDLFPLDVDGVRHWVLIVSLGSTAWGSGSGTVYYVGDFDGQSFVAHGGYRRLDHGRDNYAAVTFSGLPDSERILIGWMGNWAYARELPVAEQEPRRGMMTLARRLSLTDGEHPRLVQEPITPVTTEVADLRGVTVTGPTTLQVDLPTCARLDISVDLGDAAGARFLLRQAADGDGGVVLEYHRTGLISLERRATAPGFPAHFDGVDTMPVEAGSSVSLTVWTDITSVEVFADGGSGVLTDLVDAPSGSAITCEGIGGRVLVDLRVSAPA